MTTRQLGFLFAFGSYFMYSLNTPIARQAFLDGMVPDTLLAYRFTLGAILFWITISLTSLAKAKEGEKKMDRFGILMGLGSGLLNGTAIYLFFNSLNLLPASFVAVLGIGIYIIVVIVLLTIFGEPFTWVHGVRLALGLSGVWLLVGPSGDLGSQGVLWLAIGSACFAVHMISIQWYLREYNTWAVSTLVVTATAALLIVLWLNTGRQSGEIDFAIPSFYSWIAVFFLAICSSWLGRVFSYRALSILGSGELALLTPTETLLAILWSVLFLREWLEPAQWVGAALIILGVGFVGVKWVYNRRFKATSVPAD
ncbi:MAG: DMT family transporter [Chloroflexota bacterium]